MIGTQFRAQREALGLTQKEVAEKLCVGQTMISQVEIGMKIPSVALVKMAAELFGCTTDSLILGDGARDSA